MRGGIPCRWARKREEIMTKHGGRYTPAYQSWDHMKARCYNPNNSRYHRYGGRGIVVCERWLKFEDFLADMGPRPKGLTLERKNNDGNYEPGNCEWATRRTQGRNSSHCKLSHGAAEEIRTRSANGETNMALGYEFGVSHTQIHRIARGKQWSI